MLASRAKETTTTTGTGNLTLAGAATNFLALSAEFELEHPIQYTIIDDTNNVWEVGIGYLSASTTLVRDIVLDNSSNTTSALNLSAGTKTVVVSPVPSGIFPGWTTLYSATKRIIPRQFVNSSVTFTAGTDELCLYPVEVPFYGSCDALQCIVNTAVASTKARIGLYRKNSSGGPGVILAQTGDLDTTTTGLKTGTITAFKLRPGEYFLGIVANGAVGFAGAGTGGISPTSMGGYSDSADGVIVASARSALGSGWTTLASSPTISYTPRAGAGPTPITMIRFA